jgi:hypothetical protein
VNTGAAKKKPRLKGFEWVAGLPLTARRPAMEQEGATEPKPANFVTLSMFLRESPARGCRASFPGSSDAALGWGVSGESAPRGLRPFNCAQV